MVRCVYCEKILGKKFYNISVHGMESIICNHCKFLFETALGEKRQDNNITMERIYYSLSLLHKNSKVSFKKVG